MTNERKFSTRLGIAAAVAGLMASGSAVAQYEGGDSGWKYTITPYLWGTSVDGTLTTDNREADFSADFSDLIEFTDAAGALRFEAIDKWGFYGDVWFTSLSAEDETPLGDIEVDFDQTILEAGVLYAFQPELTGYIGARYQDVDADVDIPVVGERSAGTDWTDAVIGARFTPSFGGRWNGILRADIGGGDSDLTWLAQAGVGYRFGDNWSGQIAYRYLKTEFEEDNFEWDIAQEGFGLGLSYQF